MYLIFYTLHIVSNKMLTDLVLTAPLEESGDGEGDRTQSRVLAEIVNKNHISANTPPPTFRSYPGAPPTNINNKIQPKITSKMGIW